MFLEIDTQGTEQDMAPAVILSSEKAAFEADIKLAQNDASCTLAMLYISGLDVCAQQSGIAYSEAATRACSAVRSVFRHSSTVSHRAGGEIAVFIPVAVETAELEEYIKAAAAAVADMFKDERGCAALKLYAGAAVSPYCGGTYDALCAKALDALSFAREETHACLALYTRHLQARPTLCTADGSAPPAAQAKPLVTDTREGRFGIVITVLTVVVFAVLLLLSIYVTSRATKDTYLDSMRVRTDDTVTSVEASLKEYGSQAAALCGGIRFRHLLDGSALTAQAKQSLESEIADAVYNSIGTLNGFEGFTLTDADDNYYLNDTVFVHSEQLADKCTDIAEREIGGVYYIFTECAGSDSPLMAIKVPIKTVSGQICGYATLYMNASIYNAALASSVDDRFIYENTTRSLIGQSSSLKDVDINVDSATLTAQAEAAAAGGSYTYKYTTANGQEMLAAVSTSDIFPLTVVSCMPSVYMTSTVHRYAIIQIATSLLLVVVLAIIVIFTYRSTTKPISDMINQCSRLANGDSFEPFDAHGDSELKKLASAFNMYRERLESSAYTDALLYIGTRAKFLHMTDAGIKRAPSAAFDCCLIDINHFGNYNDMFSLEIGDALLVAAAERLKTIFGDRLYRIDGDVFMGVMPCTDSALIFEKVRGELHRPIQIGQLEIMLECTVAVCRYPNGGTSAAQLLENANIALANAKDTGVPGIVFSNEITKELKAADAILTLLRKSLIEHTLEVWYQPIYNVETGAFTTAEALMRLRGEDGKLMNTGRVIEIAERHGMIDAVGEYVLAEAVHMIGRLRARGCVLDYVHVNMSAQQIVQNGCVKRAADIIEQSGGKPSDISIELTETAVMSSFEAASDAVKQFRALGAHVSLDDFGAGYSGLGYLSALELDILKLDAGLVRGIETDETACKYLTHVIELAKLKNLHTVAEGVENAEALEAVENCGADYIQGYYFSKPLCESDFARFME